MTQTIIFGATSQTLRHVPPARVTSATYAIEDLTRADTASDRVIASGSATVSATSLTTSAAAGRSASNSKRIAVTATTGTAIGQPAVIVGLDGQSEIFAIAAITSGSSIEAEAPLAGTYASGSAVYGIEITASVPNDLAADEDILEQERPLRVVWTYTIGTTPLKVQDLIEFVRHTDAATLDGGAAVLHVRKLYPDLSERTLGGVTLETLARELTDVVQDDLRQRSIAPERFLAGPAGVQLLALRLIAHAGELGYAPGSRTTTDGAWAREALARYRQRLEALTVGEPGKATAEPDFTSDTTTATPSHQYRGPTLRM